MEQATGGLSESSLNVRDHDQTAFESIQFNEEIQRIIAPTPENAGSFTALLELPPMQAMELLHSPNCDGAVASGEPLNDINNQKYLFHSFNRNLAFPSNATLIERAAMFSVPNEQNSLPEEASLAPLNSSASLNTVKNEPPEADSNPSSTQGFVCNAAIEGKNERAAKRKEREKKVKGSSKKSKSVADETSGDGEKLPYVHVRARRGQATDSHSLAERARREKINARMKLLQELVPGCNKISGTALVLDEIINHVQFLQRQVEFLSMKLAAVNPTIDFDLDSIMATGGPYLMDSNFSGMVTPLMWPEVPVNGNRQQYQQQWQSDAFNQPIWGRGEENHNFMTPENSLLSYGSSANSGTSELNFCCICLLPKDSTQNSI